MAKEKDIAYSSGKVIILWRLIFFVSQNSVLSVQDLAALIEDSGVLGGTALFDDALRIGKYCDFLEINKGKVILSEECITSLLPLCSSVDPNVFVVRFMLQRIIQGSLYGLQWLLFFNRDVDIFKISIPEEWADLLEQAGLFDFSEKDVEDWWNAILQSINSFDLANTKEIGDVGEKLTIDHEKARLLSDGEQNPQHFVIRVSRISDNYGYDVTSVKGKRWTRKKFDSSAIQIEVKSSVMTNVNNFRFKISRNEWNVALRNIDSYYFYCWLGISVDKHTATDGPFVIPAKSFINIVPRDRHASCEWSECRLTIDLTANSL